MRLWRASTGQGTDAEEGTAALEFILAGLVLLVPIVYLVIALGAIQGQSLGVEAGARHIARAVATASDPATAADRADRVLAAIVEEYDLDAGSVEVSLRCTPVGAACPDAGATLVVTVAVDVALPLVPPVLGLERLARVPVASTAVQKVSRTWGVG
ncbi:TadE family protein [Microbacterium sp.]|uniref:TadE family protein n=1 Tax=Microbacterium sp. TaxID=51671 RepID=UPI0039E2DBB2